MLLLAALAAWMPLFEGLAPRALDRPPPATPRPSARRVVLVSIDGLAPWVLADTPAPTLERLAREGTRAQDAFTVEPSITLTSHASMLSGVGPERHGVLWNRYQPWSTIRVPTVFSACRATGMRCGLFAGKTKFAHFAEPEPGVEIYRFAPDAAGVLAAAARSMQSDALDFAFVHLAEVDLTGHEHGWGSAEQRAAIARVDRELGRFLEELAPGPRPLTLIVTADHGGFGTHHHERRPQNRRIPWLAWGDGVPAGAELAEPVATLDTAPTVLALLGRPVPAVMEGRALLGGDPAGGR